MSEGHFWYYSIGGINAAENVDSRGDAQRSTLRLGTNGGDWCGVGVLHPDESVSFFFFFLESALFTVISLLYVLTTVTKCQIAGDLPLALFGALEPGWSPG